MRKELLRILTGILITIVSLFAVLLFGLFLYFNFYSPRLSENYGKVDVELFAEDDEIWPSKYMSDEIVDRLTENNFEYFFEHLSFKGGHNGIMNHFDVVFGFLDEHFK